jgi:hypothetical protein
MKYYTLSIFCNKCRYLLFKYKKGGSGQLIKIRESRILENYTEGLNTKCPKCENVFGREFLFKGQPAYKVLSGQLYNKK